MDLFPGEGKAINYQSIGIELNLCSRVSMSRWLGRGGKGVGESKGIVTHDDDA